MDPTSVNANSGTERDGTSPETRAAVTLLRERPPHTITLDQVAARAGVPLDVVLERFPTWSDLLLATVDEWSSQRLAELAERGAQLSTRELLRHMLRAYLAEPRIASLLTSLQRVARTPQHPLSGLISARREQLLELLRSSLRRDVEAGREPEGLDSPDASAALLDIYEAFRSRIGRDADPRLTVAFEAVLDTHERSWTGRVGGLSRTA